MSSYTFAGIVLAALAFYVYFFFYQNIHHRVGIGPNTSHQAEHRALQQSGNDDN